MRTTPSPWLVATTSRPSHTHAGGASTRTRSRTDPTRRPHPARERNQVCPRGPLVGLPRRAAHPPRPYHSGPRDLWGQALRPPSRPASTPQGRGKPRPYDLAAAQDLALDHPAAVLPALQRL